MADVDGLAGIAGRPHARQSGITVAKAADLWLERARREQLEPTTIAAYGQHVRLHIVPQCGSWKLSQLTRPIVEGWRDDLVQKLSRQWRGA